MLNPDTPALKSLRKRRRRGLGPRAGIVFFSVVLIVLLISLLVPLAVSSELVRQRLEREIGDWTGHTVSLGENPQISFFPRPTVTVNKLAVGDPGSPQMTADSLSASFHTIDALTGNLRFTDFRLVRPVLTLAQDGSDPIALLPSNGRIADGVAARADVTDTGQAQRATTRRAFETLHIENGRLINGARPTGQSADISSIDATLEWDRLNRPMAFSGSAIWRGETVRAQGTLADVLAALGGLDSNFQIAVNAAPLTLNFQGNANFSKAFVFQGPLELATPSMQRMLEWSRISIDAGDALGALQLDGELVASPTRMQLDNAVIQVNENRGVGVIDLDLADSARPGVNGTLAFSSLDIGTFLSAFMSLPDRRTISEEPARSALLDQIDLDLRFSAQTAQFGPFSLNDVAAAARVRGGRADFDIGAGKALGGSVTGNFKVTKEEGMREVSVKLSTQNSRLKDLSDTFALAGLALEGTGALLVDLSSPFAAWRDKISGTIRLTGKDGALAGINVPAFLTLTRQDRFFDLSEAGDGSIPFTEMLIEAETDEGKIDILSGSLESETYGVRLEGVVPYRTGGMALQGIVTGPAETVGDETEPGDVLARFFIGGSWPNAYVSPVRRRSVDP